MSLKMRGSALALYDLEQAMKAAHKVDGFSCKQWQTSAHPKPVVILHGSILCGSSSVLHFCSA